MPEKPRRSMSRAISSVCRRRPGTATRLIAGSGSGILGLRRCWPAIGSTEPLSEFDVVAVGIADFGAGIGFADPRAPHNVDSFLLQIVGCLLHVVDFESDHAISEMLVLRCRIDRRPLIRDQLDGSAAEVEVNELDRHAKTGALNPVAHSHLEPKHAGIERG